MSKIVPVALGQIAQRLGLVRFVSIDVLADEEKQG